MTRGISFHCSEPPLASDCMAAEKHPEIRPGAFWRSVLSVFPRMLLVPLSNAARPSPRKTLQGTLLNAL